LIVKTGVLLYMEWNSKYNHRASY